ncbi:helix-turn-helix transcriptional regulator [Nocardioides alcanivorans]|uniref:helix-turn-helix transcriptional regulator n=1 Tax=Nocardioides alcanivorans TaxID=2897352 RepID=UPI001F2892B5|nr:YafY family protein [Nocardioides alcanivorans]
MANTSARMLRLLSLLQTHRYWPGGELADRLEVSGRTLRRDIDRLRDLGYPVDAVRGVAGGYQLQAGGQLPPLLLEDEEAVAIAIGLRTAAAGTVQGLQESSLQALTKVVSLMPPRLRRRIDALQSQTTPAPSWGPPIDANALITLAQGCRDDETVRFGYTAREGVETRRHVEPFGLASLGSRWYLVGWCRERHDWRSFRVDRITAPSLTGTRFRPRELPADDALAFVRAGIRSVPKKYDVRVRFAAPVETVAAAVGRWATITPAGDGALMVMQADDFFWPLSVVATIDAEFTIESPPELVEAIADSAARLTRAAAHPSTSPE